MVATTGPDAGRSPGICYLFNMGRFSECRPLHSVTTMHFPRRKGTLINVGGLASTDWQTFGFDAAQASDWAHAGFDAFEAALALGDGFNLMSAVHERSMLHRIAADWRDAGLRSVEGLHWHQSGFIVKITLRSRATNHSISTATATATATAIRAGYVKDEYGT